jgi:hypothetical protein
MRTIIAAAIATVLALCGNARAGEACRHVLNMDPVFIGNWEWLYIPTENRAELAVEDCPGDNAFYLACKPGKSEYWIEFDHHKGPAVPRRELTVALDTGITLRLAGTSTMTTPEGHFFETGGFTSDPLSQEQINVLKQAKNEIAVIAGLADGEPIVFKVKGIRRLRGSCGRLQL